MSPEVRAYLKETWFNLSDFLFGCRGMSISEDWPHIRGQAKEAARRRARRARIERRLLQADYRARHAPAGKILRYTRAFNG